jgi:hypothetical protein
MADIKASQRVRLWDGTNDRGFAQGQEFFVTVGDGTQELDLVTINSAYGATPVAVPIAGKYEATPTTYTDGDAVPFLTDANGRLLTTTSLSIGYEFTDDSAFTVATSKVAAVGMLADETAPDSVDEGDVGIPRMTLDRKQLMVIVDPTTDANRLAIDASGRITSNINGTVTVTATDLDIRDLTHVSDSVKIGDGTDFLAIDASGNITVNVNGTVTVSATDLDIRDLNLTQDAVRVSANTTANSETNPIWVKLTDVASASEVSNYDTSASVAVNATDNHDYTVVNTFYLKSVIAAASGAMKLEVQVGPVATLVTKAVFFTSGAKPTEQIFFDPPIEVPNTSTGTVRVIRRNDDNQAMDVYSTIVGYDK